MLADDRVIPSLRLTDHEMMELPLLLPGWQVEALERVAADSRLTVAQFLRRLVTHSIAEHTANQREHVLYPDCH